MKPTLIGLCLIFSLAAHTDAFAKEPFHAIEAEVLKIIRTKYPDAELVKEKNRPYIQVFSQNTREFVIYRLNKVGEWQKPFNIQGPDRGGLSVQFYIRKGIWEGALMVPYYGTEDLHVFKETNVVKNSTDGNWHIWAEVLTPKIDSPENVAGNLVRLFNDFEKYE